MIVFETVRFVGKIQQAASSSYYCSSSKQDKWEFNQVMYLIPEVDTRWYFYFGGFGIGIVDKDKGSLVEDFLIVLIIFIWGFLVIVAEDGSSSSFIFC